MKIGILTYHRSINYGAFLQAYALCESIKRKIDCDVEIIDYNSTKAQYKYLERVLKKTLKKRNMRNSKTIYMF